jgi:hypothetical protein
MSSSRGMEQRPSSVRTEVRHWLPGRYNRHMGKRIAWCMDGPLCKASCMTACTLQKHVFDHRCDT